MHCMKAMYNCELSIVNAGNFTILNVEDQHLVNNQMTFNIMLGIDINYFLESFHQYMLERINAN